MVVLDIYIFIVKSLSNTVGQTVVTVDAVVM
jgi:hypothetical protein